MTPPRPMARRALLRGALGLTLLPAMISCGRVDPGSSQEATSQRTRRRLRASIVGKGDGDLRLLLNAAGLGERGQSLEFSTFASGQLVVEAFKGGSLDVGNMSEIPPIFAAAADDRSFRQIAILHGDVNNQAVLVPRDSAVRSIAELRGKRVGYVRATTAQYFLIRMLESAGLKWSDITPAPMDVADGLAAFSNGTLDAWAIYGYPIQRAIATMCARILKTALGILSGNYLLTAHVDALADPQRVELIADYLRTSRRAFAWAADHPDEWARIVAQDIGVPLEYVEDQFHRRSAVYEIRPIDAAAMASQQDVADLFAAQALIPHPVDMRPWWDDRFNDIIREKI